MTDLQRIFFVDHHFDKVFKKIDSILINMDIHITLFQHRWFGNGSKTAYQDFYRRRVRIGGDWEETFQLERHDMLIYLGLHCLQHFLKHMLYGFREGDFYVSKHIGLLFDITILIQAENDSIDWDYYCQLCSSYRLDSEMACVLSFVNQIFGDIVPVSVIGRLEEKGNAYEKKLFYQSVCKFMLGMELRDFLTWDIRKLTLEFVRFVIRDMSIVKTPEKVQMPSQYAFGNERISRDMVLQTGLSSDKDLLSVKLDMKYMGMRFEEYALGLSELKNMYDTVCICWYCYDDHAGLMEIESFMIDYIQSGMEQLKCYSDEIKDFGAKRISILKVRYGESMEKKEYSRKTAVVTVCRENNDVVIELPWEFIGFRPDAQKVLALNVMWSHYEDRYTYAMQSLTGNSLWYDIAGMVRLQMP